MTTNNNQPDIIITKLNESHLKVLCKDRSMEIEIQNRFSFEVPNAQYDKRVKKGHWDGIKKLYNRRYKTMPCGLLFPLVSFIKKRGYTFSLEKDIYPTSSLTKDDILNVVQTAIQPHDDKGNPIELYDSQLDALHHMFSFGRSLCISSTSSGKSLIIYCAIRMLQMLDEFVEKKIFVVVPSAYLVEQLYKDFEDYSSGKDIEWTVAKHCQKVNKDYSKFIDRQIVITTWQSMKNLPRPVIDQMQAVFVDEVHGAKSDVLNKLIDDSIHCPIKHGLTGSLDGFECHELMIEGLFGPKKTIMTARESIDRGMASDIAINMIILKHTQEDRKKLMSRFLTEAKNDPKRWYSIEKDFSHHHEKRLTFLKNLALSREGNTVIIFDTIDDFQVPVYESIKEKNPGKTFIINKDVSTADRQAIKDRMESGESGIVVCATFGTMSTGVSIKHLHNFILASSSKSIIRIVQTIGRLMRKHTTKEVGTIYDIVDDFSYKNHKGYLLNHAMKRVTIYDNENHPVKFVPLSL